MNSLLELGRRAAKAGDFASALGAFERAVAAAPESAEAWFLLGATLADLKRYPDAAHALRRAHALAPQQLEVLGSLAYLEYRLNNFAAAAPLLESLSARKPDDLDAHLKLGDTLARLGQPAQAARVFRAAIALHPDDGGLWMALAQAEDEAGDRDGACAAYERAMALRPGWVVPLAGLLALQRGGARDEHLAAARDALAAPTLADAGVAVLGYALGKALDARGEYAEAMACWQRANAARRRVAGPMDRAELAVQVERLLAEPGPAAGATGGSDDPRPVFVVGMLRSGTTLIEQIIATHPLATGCGELPTLPAIAARPRDAVRDAAHYLAVAERRGTADARRLVDKLPLNFFHLGVAARLFPRAHVVWCRRDPRDVALSNFSENTALQFPFATDLEDIALMQDAHDRLMRHWQAVLPLPILEVEYEAFVADLEPQARRLIEFLGLDWDPVCLDFHASQRAVQTPSRWQVRQPAHTRSVGRWRAYQEWLQ